MDILRKRTLDNDDEFVQAQLLLEKVSSPQAVETLIDLLAEYQARTGLETIDDFLDLDNEGWYEDDGLTEFE